MWTTGIESVLYFSNLFVTQAANILAQSTLLIAAGLIIARLLRSKGAAAQSAILRATLAAVVLCPLASLCLSEIGVSGLSLDLPRATTHEAEVATPLVAGELKPPEPYPAEPVRISAPSEVARPPLPPLPVGDPVATPLAGFEQPSDTPFLASHETPTSRRGGFAIFYTALTAVWLVVSGLLLLLLLLAHVRMARLCCLAKEAPAELIAICRSLARKMHVRPPVLLISPLVKSPCLTGFSRAAILLPTSGNVTDCRAPWEVLAHELAHLVRRDCVWNLTARVVRAVLSFQPLLWVLTRRIEEASDEVADDYVLQQGMDRRDYASQLVAIAERHQPSPSEALAGTGVIAFRSSVGRRVQRILDTTRALSVHTGRRAALVIITVSLFATLTLSLTFGCRKEEPNKLQANIALRQETQEARIWRVAGRMDRIERKLDEILTSAKKANMAPGQAEGPESAASKRNRLKQLPAYKQLVAAVSAIQEHLNLAQSDIAEVANEIERERRRDPRQRIALRDPREIIERLDALVESSEQKVEDPTGTQELEADPEQWMALKKAREMTKRLDALVEGYGQQIIDPARRQGFEEIVEWLKKLNAKNEFTTEELQNWLVPHMRRWLDEAKDDAVRGWMEHLIELASSPPDHDLDGALREIREWMNFASLRDIAKIYGIPPEALRDAGLPPVNQHDAVPTQARP